MNDAAEEIPVEENLDSSEEKTSSWEDFLEDDYESPPADEVTREEEPRAEEVEEEAEGEEVGGEAEPEPVAEAETSTEEEIPATTPEASNAEILEQIRRMQSAFEAQTAPGAPGVDPAAQADEQQQLREQQRKAALEQLQQQYRLSDEDADNALTSPQEVLPRLLAEAQLRATEEAVRLMAAQAPRLIADVVRQQTVMQQNAGAFFRRWPKLMGHVDQVNNIGRMWRSQNPQASPEDFLENVGAMSHMILKIPVEDAPEKAPTVQNSPPPPPPRGGVQQRKTPKQPANPFTQLADEMAADDQNY